MNRIYFRSRGFLGCLSLVVFAALFGFVVTGCTSSKAAQKTGGTPVKNVNSKGLAKLSPAEIQQKIAAVQADKNIPESAKPNIIDGIRAQGEP